jgi:hypothetical protein
VVKHEQRYTVDEALRAAFFRDNVQCRKDIEEVEIKVGSQWISPLLSLLPQESFDVVDEEVEDTNNNFS